MEQPTPEQWLRVSESQEGLRAAITTVLTWAEEHPASFSGMWLDNEAALAGTGPVVLTVAVTGEDTGALAAELRELTSLGYRLVTVHRPHSQVEMRREVDRLVGRYMRPAGSVNGIGIDVKQGAIEVMLAAPLPALEHEIAAATFVPVRIRYGHARSV